MTLDWSFQKQAARAGCMSFVFSVAVVFLLSAARVWAQTGKMDFLNYCAQCHGNDGKGGKNVDVPGPDLTHLSQRNGDSFPSQEVYEVIDGRKKLAAHQRLLDMPLWGIYMQPQGVPKDVAEAKAKSRITALVHYLQVIQEK